MKKQAVRSAQYLLTAQFIFNYNDWVVDTADGTKKTFGSTKANSVDPSEANLNAGTGVVFDCINLPRGAVIVGGELICETAYVGIGTGATVKVGTSTTDDALLASTDLDALAAGSRTALALTAPLSCNDGSNVRLTTAGLTATATAGKFRLTVTYIIDGKANEVVPS